jgi:hypothetical protein
MTSRGQSGIDTKKAADADAKIEAERGQETFTYRVAYSRPNVDKPKAEAEASSSKVYVQDLMTEDSERLWKLIDEEGACVYMCGCVLHSFRLFWAVLPLSSRYTPPLQGRHLITSRLPIRDFRSPYSFLSMKILLFDMPSF